MQQSTDEFWMIQALELARKAADLAEVPVGALIVKDNILIGSGFNKKESLLKSTAHAEILAIEEASLSLKAWRLTGATLYVTLEPCVMCAGALVQSRIDRVVFGTLDPKGGALGSLFKLNEDLRLNHRFEVTAGVCESQCSEILKEFFKQRRTEKKGF